MRRNMRRVAKEMSKKIKEVVRCAPRRPGRARARARRRPGRARRLPAFAPLQGLLYTQHAARTPRSAGTAPAVPAPAPARTLRCSPLPRR